MPTKPLQVGPLLLGDPCLEYIKNYFLVKTQSRKELFKVNKLQKCPEEVKQKDKPLKLPKKR